MGERGRNVTALSVIAEQCDDKLTEKSAYLFHIPQFLSRKFPKKLLKKCRYMPLILSKPEDLMQKEMGQRTVMRGGNIFGLYFQIETVFCQGILGTGNLGMFHMGTGDIEGVGSHRIRNAVDDSLSASGGNKVNLIVAVSVAVAGYTFCYNATGEFQDLEYGSFKRK